MAINYKICPKCGSKDSVKILYGYPTGEGIMLATAGKVKLGGCMLPLDYRPEYHCNNCEYQWDREEAIYYAYGKIKGLNISIGGFQQGHQEIYIDLKTGEFKYSHSIEEESFFITLYPDVIEDFIDKLIETNLLNWKRNYYDNDILDGTQWEIEIIRDGRNFKRYGNNNYPKEWERLCKLIGETAGRHIG